MATVKKNIIRAKRLPKSKADDLNEHFMFQCKGCTMRGREDLWESFISSISGAYDKQHDNSYLWIEEEPDNPHDSNAIKVICKGEMFGTLGYVARESTEEIRKIVSECSEIRFDMQSESDLGQREIEIVVTWNRVVEHAKG